MTTQEMMQTKLRPGYWFVNTANFGEKPNWEMRVMPHQADPNILFGYPAQEFLAKQYKD